jgi:4-amino-4-deoxy-L-arabinose transferase-like glycosyltransferase
MKFYRPILFLFLLAVCGVVIVLYSTQAGIGLGSDSFFYISGAENIQAGLGYSRPAGDGSMKPITHFPPLYSITLAFLNLFGFEILVAARWLSAVLFGVNILVLGLVLLRFTDSTPVALIGSFIALTSPVMISVHSWALSEPLFISFELFAFWALIRYLNSGDRRILLLASVSTTLAYMVRYTGSTLVMMGMLVLLLPFGRTWRRRAIDCTLFVGTSLLVPLVWLMRNIVVYGSATNRILAWHPITLERISEGLNTISLWLLPSLVPGLVRNIMTILVLIFLVCISAWHIVSKHIWRLKDNTDGPKRISLLVVASVFSFVYICFLVLSISFFDASTPLDNRVLSPLFPTGILLISYLPQEFVFSKSEKRWYKIALGAAILVFGGLNAARGARTVNNNQLNGLGFSSQAWRESEITQWVKGMPQGVPLYTNELDAVYLLTGRVAFQLPIKWDPVSATIRDDYEKQLSAMRTRLHSENGVLALFLTLQQQQAIFPSEEELAQGLSNILHSSDGSIYHMP